MGALLADIKLERSSARKVTCPLAFVMESFDEADAADLTEALLDTQTPSAAIERALRKRQFNMGEGAVATHRRGACSCVRTRG